MVRTGPLLEKKKKKKALFHIKKRVACMSQDGVLGGLPPPTQAHPGQVALSNTIVLGRQESLLNGT